MKTQITFEEFLEIESKLQVRVGEIDSAERVPKSKKLLKLTVNFGDETRIVVTNIGDRFQPEDLIAELYAFVTNLVPTTIMGIESQAMIILPVDKEGKEDSAGTIGTYIFK